MRGMNLKLCILLTFEATCLLEIMSLVYLVGNTHRASFYSINWRSTYSFRLTITKTCLYNFDPFKPHFYIVKLGFTGVYIIFLISAQNIDCGYSLEPPRRGGSNGYQNLCFEQKYEKYRNFLSENFHFLVVKFSVYLNRRVFVMKILCTVHTCTCSELLL